MFDCTRVLRCTSARNTIIHVSYMYTVARNTIIHVCYNVRAHATRLHVYTCFLQCTSARNMIVHDNVLFNENLSLHLKIDEFCYCIVNIRLHTESKYKPVCYNI